MLAKALHWLQKKFLICQKRCVLAAEDSYQPLWEHNVQMLKAVLEKMSCYGRVLLVRKRCCKMRCKKEKVENVAFLYQTTPARLNAADCPFNPTSTMPLNSMWPRCALPRKLLLTFDFDCFVPFAFKRFQFQVFKFENKCCYLESLLEHSWLP